MAWTVEFAPEAEKELAALGSEPARRILRFLRDRLAVREDPRSLGEALRGKQFGAFWKYRVGDYRIVAQIEDETIRILVLRVAHRREVYRR